MCDKHAADVSQVSKQVEEHDHQQYPKTALTVNLKRGQAPRVGQGQVRALGIFTCSILDISTALMVLSRASPATLRFCVICSAFSAAHVNTPPQLLFDGVFGVAF